MTISEQTILEALHQVPLARWGEALRLLETLKSNEPLICSASDLAQSNLVGLWAERNDVGDSRQFARRLRQQAETRVRSADAAGQ